MEKENASYIDIYPTKKGRRVLIFLADLLLNYCLAVFIFSIVVFNIASNVTDYKVRLNNNLKTINNRYDILYNENLLYFDKIENKYDFDTNLATTNEIFLKYYVINEGNDFIYDYFKSINLSDSKINEIYKEKGEKYFNFDSSITMKEEYIELFAPKFSKTDDLSSKGEIEYSSFKENFFTILYNRLLENILEYDLNDGNYSYITLTKELSDYNKYSIRFNTINIYISFFISTSLVYILVPLLSKDRSTLAMKLMKAKRIDMLKSEPLKRRKYSIIIINNFLMNTSIIFFIGFVYIGFSSMFSHTSLLFLSLAGIIYSLINLIFMQINKLNRSINELATNSIIINKSDLEEIYKAKGY